jgi:hypothetical protein
MQKQKSKLLNAKIKKFITIPIMISSIMIGVGCTSIQKREEVKLKKQVHNVNDAISFVRNQKDTKMLNKSILMTNVIGNNVDQIKEYPQRSPRELNVKRKFMIYESVSLITRATQDNFIYVSDPDNLIKGYVTLYKEQKFDSIYEYNANESLNFISTSLGELMIKVYSDILQDEVKLFYNKIVCDSVISFLYSTYHLDKKESEKIINEIWKN